MAHDIDPPSPCAPGRRADADSRFRALFQQSPFSTQIMALDGRTVEVNQAFQDLWGIDPDSEVMAYILSPAYNVLTDPQLLDKGVVPLFERAIAGESVHIRPCSTTPPGSATPATGAG